MNSNNQNPYQKIYQTVSKIPKGTVASYKRVAELSGLAGHARIVGYALHKLPEGSGIPWYRVINSQGKISYSVSKYSDDNLQKSLLLEEGIVFSKSSTVDMNIYCI